MARKYDFTRTISSTTIKVKAIDNETFEVFDTECTIPSIVTDEAKLLKIAKKNIETSTVTVVTVTGTVTKEAKYGMTLADFLANAVCLSGEAE